MRARVGIAVVCPLAVSLLGLGPTAVAEVPGSVPQSAVSAVTVGSCIVKPSDDGATVTVTGTGFIGTGGAALRGNAPGATVGLGNLDGLNPPGVFNLTGLPPTDYAVHQQKGGVVPCRQVRSDKATNQELVRAARDRGFNAGVKAGKAAAQENCDAAKPKPPKKPPGLAAQDEAVEKAFNDGFLAGATSAFDAFCRTGR
ncbi:hypothetical protein [Streptomyces sp. RerS4]|uniref:hypothetical protein n=1 Tax=Streptomyces sp. RerS4 TaxID=2942449 RepID=UPI00201C4C24|nr:hypothetical protein [Streptomyces sp. RerS4]UQW99880.1 hypothetical protein M4D82_04515 [Streptomyces sp. RerS4]